MFGLTLKDNIYIFEWEFIIKYHGLLLLNLILPTYHGIIGIPRSPFISVRHCIMALSVFLNRRLFRLIKISRNYFSPDRRLFRLAYVSRHYRYFYITVYFGSAKVSRHRYSSHIIKYLIIVAYDTSAIYLSVSEHSSHRVSLGKPKDTFVSSLSCSVNRTILRLISAR